MEPVLYAFVVQQLNIAQGSFIKSVQARSKRVPAPLYAGAFTNGIQNVNSEDPITNKNASFPSPLDQTSGTSGPIKSASNTQKSPLASKTSSLRYHS